MTDRRFLLAAFVLVVGLAFVLGVGRQRSARSVSAVADRLPRAPSVTPRPAPRPPVPASAATSSMLWRFARAYARWDRGDRTTGVARALRAVCSPELWASLRARRSRPVAYGGPLPRVAAIERTGDRATLMLSHPRGGVLATLVVSDAADGPRVAAITR